VRRLHNRGLSLVESLLTLFLFALALVVVSKLVTGSQQLVRKSEGRSQAIQAAQWAIAEIRQRVELSSSVEEPTVGESSDKLRLTAFQRDEIGRLPTVLSPPNRTDPLWIPYDTAYLENIEFRKEGDGLLETVGGKDIYLASSLKDLNFENLAQQIQLEITINEGTKDTKVVSRVAKP
jgi:type II secretory pathway pseudopilin PulG